MLSCVQVDCSKGRGPVLDFETRAQGGQMERWRLSLQVSNTAVLVRNGSSVTLLCKNSSMSNACWSRTCNGFWCVEPIVEVSGPDIFGPIHPDKYSLRGDLSIGELDLTLSNVKPADDGTYCCMTSTSPNSMTYHLKIVNGCVRELLKDVCFIYNDIKHFASPNANQCQQNCTQLDACQYFTYIHSRQECYLKGSAGGRAMNVIHLEDRVSGYTLKDCEEKGKKTVSMVKMFLKVPPGVDLNDPLVKEQILTQIQAEITQTDGGASVRWKEQSDGKVFQKKGEKERMTVCKEVTGMLSETPTGDKVDFIYLKEKLNF
ncbi:uncharacterized protein LOC112267813 isoform X2 [Oncorhynchus tshawytscha]|uniref:uncharacterized protein LOC112267813 isoform X2 n=1 Tax=Oncorhynchus tshawytscha TaxID=74940 RepID=UPI001C3DD573|nr:uncharacterized protein LOC112267813 isoform X2 [Oncorhynchus tshawytscha]